MNAIKNNKIFKIYSQPGKWYYLKYLIAFIVLKIQSLHSSIFKKQFKLEKLENLQGLSTHSKAYDAVLFNTASQNGVYIAAGIERKHKGRANSHIYVATREFGLMEAAFLPHSFVNADSSTIIGLKKYSSVGLLMEPIKPMKKWLISYNGEMRTIEEPSRLFQVKIQGTWTSKVEPIAFTNNINFDNIAKAIAKEDWSKNYLNLIKDSYYEQIGNFSGFLSIDGNVQLLNEDSYRNHSFGIKPNWSFLHRFVNHTIYLDDGTVISLRITSEPKVFSLLEIGYVSFTQQKVTVPIKSTDFLLYQHGENGTPPNSYAFSVKTNNEIFEVQINVVSQSFYYKDNSKIFQRFIECWANKVKGNGVSEWAYGNASC